MQEDGFIDVQGLSLEYGWIAGKVEAPILVLLHEGLGCVEMWKSFPRALAELTGYSVFVYSRQGYGRSTTCALPRPVSYMHDEAELLGHLLQRLPGNEFILVGHSDGASIASIFAGSPNSARLHGLVLLAPHFFVENMSVQSIEKVKILYQKTDLRSRLKKYHPQQVDTAFNGWNDVWLSEAFKSWNICEYLPEIKIPTLVIQGDSDEYGSLKQVQTAERLINAQVTTRLFRNCGHSVHKDCEQETVEEIARFLKKLNYVSSRGNR